MLHANHVALLEKARGFGGRLVVGVVSDQNVLEYKRRPVMNENERLRVVTALGCVDEAFVIRAPLIASTMEEIIARHGIGAVVYAGDATPDFYRPAEALGIMHRHTAPASIPARSSGASSPVTGTANSSRPHCRGIERPAAMRRDAGRDGFPGDCRARRDRPCLRRECAPPAAETS